MKYVRKCPHCGGDVIEKKVTEVLYGGIHTAFLIVKAGVCLRCGDRLYTPDIIRRFESVELKLRNQEISDFQPIGCSFQVAAA